MLVQSGLNYLDWAMSWIHKKMACKITYFGHIWFGWIMIVITMIWPFKVEKKVKEFR